MGGHDGGVEPVRPRSGTKSDAVGYPAQVVYEAAGADLVQPGRDRVDIGDRAADDGPPDRRSEHGQHAVVAEEGEQVAGRVVQCGRGRAGPDRRDQRGQEILDEVRRKVVPGNEFPERLGPGVGRGQQAGGGPVELLHLREHRQVPRTGQVSQCREQATEAACPGVLQTRAAVAHRHRHLGIAGGDAEFVEQPAQRRIGTVVVDEECGVDGHHRPVAAVHPMCVRMAAQPRIGFEKGDVIALGQFVGGHQARNAAADDGDRPAGVDRVHIPNSVRPCRRMGGGRLPAAPVSPARSDRSAQR